MFLRSRVLSHTTVLLSTKHQIPGHPSSKTVSAIYICRFSAYKHDWHLLEQCQRGWTRTKTAIFRQRKSTQRILLAVNNPNPTPTQPRYRKPNINRMTATNIVSSAGPFTNPHPCSPRRQITFVMQLAPRSQLKSRRLVARCRPKLQKFLPR